MDTRVMKIRIGIPLPEGGMIAGDDRSVPPMQMVRAQNLCQGFSALSGMQVVMIDEHGDGCMWNNGIPVPINTRINGRKP
jgi:hypothetical protein